MKKQAILAVSFGTSYPDTLEKTIGAIEQDLRAAFPVWEVRRTFTSGMIRRKLQKRDGVHIDDIAEALERLVAEGFSSVLCQPTHILNGEEYHDILSAAAPYRDQFSGFAIGAPLLSASADYWHVAKCIAEAFSQQDGAAVCLMGHGTEHFSDSAYAALEYYFRRIGRRDIFVGTVEGFPDLDAVLECVREYGPRKVHLTPLMVVAGDHAQNDMASDEADSWKSAFISAGYDVECILRGLGEYPAIRELYVEHAQQAMQGIMK